MAKYRVYVCHNGDCKAWGAAQTWAAFNREANQRGLDVDLIVAGCQGRCEWGPNVTVHPGATKYSHVDGDAAQVIAAQHLANDEIVDAYVYEEPVRSE